MSKTNVFILSGEASGDLHAANLVRAWKKNSTHYNFRAWGGDRLSAEGVEIKKHIRELAFMGFVEVLQNLPTILRNFKLCKQQILDFKTDVLVLVDYPGFNLRMAKWAKSKGIKVIYYISPTVWAWKENRVHQIKRDVDRMYTILPFEPAFYRKFDMEVQYFGHPLLDEIDRFQQMEKTELVLRSNKPILAILPGSRKQELKKKLPLMLIAAEAFKESHQVVIAGAPNLPISFYEEFELGEHVTLIQNQTYQLLSQANLALVTSGTATLETALFRVPQVVCYKSSAISYRIAKALVKIKYISLVNLIMDKEVVRELIQQECRSDLMIEELNQLREGKEARSEMLTMYDQLISLLGQNGCSEKMALDLIEYLK
jgi:lipid-A-disaccharide synthase